MCTYLHQVKSTYYFRRRVPAKLQSLVGVTEFFFSLGTKDREEAKRLIPHHTIATEKKLSEARAALAAVTAPASIPSKPVPSMSREEWDFQQEQADLASDEAYQRDMETEELDEFLAANPTMAARIEAEQREQVALARVEEKYWRASVGQNKVVEQGRDTKGKAVYLDTDIHPLWMAERKPAEKTASGYLRVVQWMHERVERKSVELYTRKDMLAFKDRLLADGQSAQNINVKLGNLRTLLQWACDNDYADSNPASGIILKAETNKRMPYGLADLKSLFASPIYSEDARPTWGRGEAAYWLPVMALYSGARMEEMGQLRVGDIQHVEYPDDNGKMQKCWGFEVVGNTDANGLKTQIKNKDSERFVPLHAELLRLGFLEYVQSVPIDGRLFPELPAGAFGRLTAKWGERYGTYLDNHTGITDSRITFHSFRHTFKDYCRLAGLEEAVQNRLMGHKTPGIAATYGKGFGLHNLVQAMKRYKVPGLTIPKPPSLIN